ncbi:MAG TPA: DNA polymerase domain-containing protein, partial [Elusimicrobiota bacterium]|nr:DNA polymerase domain-containing protein [Elusimicrobiota bacterium]
VRAWTVRHGNDPGRFGLYAATLQKLFGRRAALKKTMGPHAAVKEVLGLVTGCAKREQLPLAEAARRVHAEALAAQARLGEGKPLAIPPGCTREEALAERRRERGEAAEQAQLLAPLLDAGGPDEIEAALRQKDADTRFAWDCLDGKQKAVKVFMNTFYGELGNQLSPLFQLALAGGVTSAGQRALLQVAALARQEGFRVNAGDTDSIYVVPPLASFGECDADYADGRLALEEWWAARVRVTMRVVGALRDRLNASLRASSGTEFLKLSYEDVLCPVVLTGKKKYYGIAHVNRVNFRPKDLFVRGIDAIKEGVPNFAREISYRVMWRSVALDNRLSLREIVEDVIRDALQRPEQWKFEDFVRSAAWKPDKKNQSVHLFMERMRALAALEAAELKRAADGERTPLYVLPEPGERFEFVVVAADPYGLDGYKRAHRVGDRMELAAVAKARGLRLDMAYYFTNIVAGNCARFINGEPEFQPPGGQTGDGADEEVLAAADRAAQAAARKYLEQFIARVGQEDKSVASRRSGAYRKAYVRASSRAQAALLAEAREVSPDVPAPALATLCHGWPAAPAKPDGKKPARGQAEPDSSSVDALWRAAAARAAELASAQNDVWFADYCRQRGIAPTGGDVGRPAKRPGACLLRETAAPPRMGANGLSLRELAALCEEEARVRAEAGALLERASGPILRYKAGLAGLVEGYRRVELAARRP